MKTLKGRMKLKAEMTIRSAAVPQVMIKVNQILKDASDDDEEKAMAPAIEPPKKYKFGDITKGVVSKVKSSKKDKPTAVDL